MNPVYIRMFLYFVAPVVAMLPGVTYDPVAQTVVLSLDTIAMGLAGSAVFTAGVFAKWGKS